jgi:hypothetical protein
MVCGGGGLRSFDGPRREAAGDQKKIRAVTTNPRALATAVRRKVRSRAKTVSRRDDARFSNQGATITMLNRITASARASR